ncbi:MAG: diphthamide synthesis protein [Nanoarchaeota archaeon]|nr:diphthamide synthesis protein [Nanoarchaeota archaeon]
MKTLFIEARAKGLKIPKEIIFKLPDRIALAATVQFAGDIEDIKEMIEKTGRQVILYQGARSRYPGQILGCDVEKIEEDIDAFLYIGDGIFHPKMLVIKNNKPVFAYDPFSEKFDRLDTSDINQMMKRKKGAYLKFMSFDHIGILISVKTGQYTPDARAKLEEKYPDKKFYSFVADTIDFSQLENFPFIECWVNTACLRIGYDDSHALQKSIINIGDVLPEKEEAKEESEVAKTREESEVAELKEESGMVEYEIDEENLSGDERMAEFEKY